MRITTLLSIFLLRTSKMEGRRRSRSSFSRLESIQERVTLSLWSMARLNFCFSRMTKRRSYWETLSFSKLYPCWTQMELSLAIIDVTWWELIWIDVGRILPKFFIPLFIIRRSSLLRTTRRTRLCCSVTCTVIAGNGMSSCMGVWAGKPKLTSIKTTIWSRSCRIFSPKRISSSLSMTASSLMRRTRRQLLVWWCSSNLALSTHTHWSRHSTRLSTQRISIYSHRSESPLKTTSRWRVANSSR